MHTSCWTQQVLSPSGCDLVSGASMWGLGQRWWLLHSWLRSGEVGHQTVAVFSCQKFAHPPVTARLPVIIQRTTHQLLHAAPWNTHPSNLKRMLSLTQRACCVCCDRMTALDLIQHDFVSLAEEPHSFPVAEELSQLLQQLYGSAAAALALLSEQIRCREQLTDVCAACQHVLKVGLALRSRSAEPLLVPVCATFA